MILLYCVSFSSSSLSAVGTPANMGCASVCRMMPSRLNGSQNTAGSASLTHMRMKSRLQRRSVCLTDRTSTSSMLNTVANEPCRAMNVELPLAWIESRLAQASAQAGEQSATSAAASGSAANCQPKRAVVAKFERGAGVRDKSGQGSSRLLSLSS
eukprot:scaffold58308_cov68-Phaeocystis_antarctica.AAC.6